MSRAALVMVRPKFAENIGAAARVVANMGLGRLIVVAPEVWSYDRMMTLAVRTGQRVILEATDVFHDLERALAGFHLAVGSTARLGRYRAAVGDVGAVMAEAAEALAAGRVALVLGPEKDGLTTEEISLCQRLAVISTSASASSLNVAQAAVILAHELRRAVIARDHEELSALPSGRPARREEAEAMYGHVHQVMDAVDPTGHWNRRVWLAAFRRMLERRGLMSHEVRLIRGLCRKIVWALEHPAGPAGQDDKKH